jgi:hypothetical protein
MSWDYFISYTASRIGDFGVNKEVLIKKNNKGLSH